MESRSCQPRTLLVALMLLALVLSGMEPAAAELHDYSLEVVSQVHPDATLPVSVVISADGEIRTVETHTPVRLVGQGQRIAIIVSADWADTELRVTYRGRDITQSEGGSMLITENVGGGSRATVAEL